MKYSDFLVFNKTDFNGYERWKNNELVIYTSKINNKDCFIKLEHGLQKNDKIIWVKDLPKNILNEYKKQIQETK